MAEPRFSLYSLPIGVFLPSVVSQFSPVPLQSLQSRRLSSLYLFLSLLLKTFRPLTICVYWYTSMLTMVYPKSHLFSRSILSSSISLSLDPICVSTTGERSDYESEGWFERDWYSQLRRTGSYSMSNPDCILCLLTRTS